MENLRSLSWQCISSRNEIELLRKCIHRNMSHLQVLNLSFSRINNFEDSEYDALVTMSHLSALRDLSLTRFTFKEKTERALKVFMLPHLQSLTLKDCPDQLSVLESLSKLRVPMQLTSFEISFDGSTTDQYVHPVVQFLLSFHSLEHLHLLITNSTIPEHHFSQLLANHRSLKCFVHHARNVSPTPGFNILHETHDMASCWFFGLRNILGESSLKNLGLCLPPSTAVSSSLSMLNGT